MQTLYVARKLKWLLIMNAFAFAACAPQADPQAENKAGQKQAGVIAGRPAFEKDLIRHSTVEIAIEKGPDKSMTCTGSVISQTVILTAAHCVFNVDKYVSPDAVTVLNIPANAVAAHPLYAQGILQRYSTSQAPAYASRDVALIRLEKPLPESYVPVVISQQFADVFSEGLKIAGYGYRSDNVNEAFSAEIPIQVGNVVVKPRELWGNLIFLNADGKRSGRTGKGLIVNSEPARGLKVVRDEHSSGICRGDSGGPIYLEREGRVIQLGVNINYEMRATEVCNDIGNAQFSIFLRGENLAFVAERFRQLVGSDLPGIVVKKADEDADRFEYHFGRSATPVANEDFDLNVTAVTTSQSDGRGDLVSLGYVPPSATPCADFKYRASFGNARFEFVSAAGNIVTGIQHAVLENDKFQIVGSYEAHIKKEANHLEIVALTPHGFLRNRVPKLDCRQ